MNEYTILIVDDEAPILKALKRLLVRDHYRILTAGSGEEALAKLKDHEVNLLITDHRMPGMSGIELSKKVKVDFPNVLIIMLTGYADINIAMGAINDGGIYKFILKPWHNEEVKTVVRNAVKSQSVVMGKNTLIEQVKARDVVLRELERKYPGISDVRRDRSGNVIA